MSRKTILVVFLGALALAACKKDGTSGKSALPPPSGEGAAPLPQIPDLGPGSGTGTASAVTPNAPSTFTGTLKAVEELSIAAKAGGTIVAVETDEGKTIKKGQVLFRLDSRDAQLMLRSANTQLQSAKLQLKTAQRERDRIAGLVAQNAMPQQQLDQLDSQVEGAKLAISAASNSIAMAQKQIGDATVRSPMDGVVIQKLKSVGEYVTMMPPTPVLIVQDQSSLELHFSVPDAVLPTVHIGDPATVNLASQNISRTAKITKIAPMIDPKTRTLELTAVLDNKDGTLKPGLMAEVALGATAAETPPTTPAPATTPTPAPAKPAPTKPAPAKPAAAKVAPAKKGAGQ